MGLEVLLSDEKLLEQHLAGESGAFEDLVQRYSGEMFHFLVRFTGSRATAEDVVQETFLQVHLAAESFDLSRRFKPWLFTIAANKARDILRSKARRPEIPLDASVGDQGDGKSFADFLADDLETPEVALEGQEQRRLVRDVVEAMPHNLREVLVLGYFHQFPYKEMAEILGIPLGTVKSRLHAAVNHFGQAYRTRVRNSIEPEGHSDRSV